MTLQEWFDSEKRDYGIGLAILGKYCKNRILLQNLSRKQNPGKLEYELKKALDRENAIGVNQEAMKTLPKKNSDVAPEHSLEGTSRALNGDFDKLIIVRNNRKVDFDSLPKEIQKLWEQNRDAYKEIRALHEKLKLMHNASPEDRQPLTSRIVELDDLIRVNWEKIDNWQPGKEVEATPEPTPSITIDHKRIVANRKYISTNMKKLAAEKDEKKADKLRAKVQERVNELKTAKEEMKAETIEELKKLGIEC